MYQTAQQTFPLFAAKVRVCVTLSACCSENKQVKKYCAQSSSHCVCAPRALFLMFT